MTRKILLSLTAVCLLALAGCGSPCKPHNGSVDGYCDGTVSFNCRQTCADCVESWELRACPVTCSVTATKPAEGALPGNDPGMSQPAKWALCTP